MVESSVIKLLNTSCGKIVSRLTCSERSPARGNRRNRTHLCNLLSTKAQYVTTTARRGFEAARQCRGVPTLVFSSVLRELDRAGKTNDHRNMSGAYEDRLTVRRVVNRQSPTSQFILRRYDSGGSRPARRPRGGAGKPLSAFFRQVWTVSEGAPTMPRHGEVVLPEMRACISLKLRRWSTPSHVEGCACVTSCQSNHALFSSVPWCC
mgnify:CR=1 FL=1